jgi:hypothetical protein
LEGVSAGIGGEYATVPPTGFDGIEVFLKCGVLFEQGVGCSVSMFVAPDLVTKAVSESPECRGLDSRGLDSRGGSMCWSLVKEAGEAVCPSTL